METLLPAVLVLAFACYFFAPLWMNRKDLSPDEDQNKCTKHAKDPKNDPRCIERPDARIKVIRLTNAGEFVDRCELTNALYELNWDRASPPGSFGVLRRADAVALPKLVLLYTHGWKHDASEQDTDLANFTKLVDLLRVRHESKKHVVGVYVGWNATAGLPGFLENISFWVKKSNADRIAQSAVVTKIVSAIGAITKTAPISRDQFIAIGHSFGARVLFAATAQSLVYETERAHPGFPKGAYNIVRGAADAVVLLNPAFEASRFSAIDDVSRKDECFSPLQAPLLISVATENDWATKIAFPIGQWLGLSRSVRELTTLGNYNPFVTHRLIRRSVKCTSDSEPPSLTEFFSASGLVLERIGRQEAKRIVHKSNPFIVAKTTRAVIDGHNGIWGEEFTNWLIDFIAALEMSAPSTAPTEATLTHGVERTK